MGPRYAVCSAGEPLLQLDRPLIDALHAEGLDVAIETNGILPVPPSMDWVCVSPKAPNALMVESGDELKVVYPQPGPEMDRLAHLPFRYRFVQTMDGQHIVENTRAALEFCLANPVSRLGLQTHKQLGIE